MLDLRSPYAFAIEDITPSGSDLVHSPVGGYPIHGEHSHLDVFVQFIIEWPPVDGLCFRYVEGQNLLYGVPRYDDVDPTYIHTSNLSDLVLNFCRHRSPPDKVLTRHDSSPSCHPASAVSC